MKIGLVTYKPEHVEGFDLTFTTANGLMGKLFQPPQACKTTSPSSATQKPSAKTQPSSPHQKAVPRYGETAKSNLPFDFVCPTHQGYRAKVYAYLDSYRKQDIDGRYPQPLPFRRPRLLHLPKMHATTPKKRIGLDGVASPNHNQLPQGSKNPHQRHIRR